MPRSRKTPAPQSNADERGVWKKSVEDISARAQDFARKEPAQAAGVAVLAAFVLIVLPVNRLLGGLVRLAFALLRPVLLILGAVKVFEEFEKRNNP